MDLDFSEAEIQRYARHILLPELGGAGQARLRAARVLVVGAGGLGCPVILYLAAAGVGTIGVIDDDRVELSNLQRQIAHGMADVGSPKVASAAAAALAINPDIAVEAHEMRLGPDNVDALVAAHDLVCDGSDNFRTRFLVADACVRHERILVSAAVLRFEGQISTFKPGGPCYRCLYPAAPPPEDAPNCAEAGILGSVTGVLGTLQATEAIKEIAGIGRGLSGRLLIWDALEAEFRTMRVRRDPLCPVCGSR